MLLQMAKFHFFSWLSSIPLCIYVWFILHLLYPFIVDGHLGYFCVLVMVNSAAMNDGVHVSFQIIISSGYMLRSWVVGSYDTCSLVISLTISLVQDLFPCIDCKLFWQKEAYLKEGKFLYFPCC